MDANILAAVLGSVVSIVGGVIIAAFTYNCARKLELVAHWRSQKIQHYQELFASISSLASRAVSIDKFKAEERYANAVNTLGLVAPQAVIQKLNVLRNEIMISNPNRSDAGQERALVSMLLEIRKVLGIDATDEPATFRFKLHGGYHPDNH